MAGGSRRRRPGDWGQPPRAKSDPSTIFLLRALIVMVLVASIFGLGFATWELVNDPIRRPRGRTLELAVFGILGSLTVLVKLILDWMGLDRDDQG